MCLGVCGGGWRMWVEGVEEGGGCGAEGVGITPPPHPRLGAAHKHWSPFPGGCRPRTPALE